MLENRVDIKCNFISVEAHVCVSQVYDIIVPRREVNDIEIKIAIFSKHRVNKQVVSWQSSVIEHEVFERCAEYSSAFVFRKEQHLMSKLFYL